MYVLQMSSAFGTKIARAAIPSLIPLLGQARGWSAGQQAALNSVRDPTTNPGSSSLRQRVLWRGLCTPLPPPFSLGRVAGLTLLLLSARRSRRATS